MKKVGAFIISLFILGVSLFAFFAFLKSPIISFGYTDLTILRFGKRLNILLLIFLMLINIALIHVYEFKLSLVNMCMWILIYNSVIFVLFSLSEYSSVAFWLIFILNVFVILLFCVSYIRYRKSHSKNKYQLRHYKKRLILRALSVIFVISLCASPIFAFYRFKYGSQVIAIENNPFPEGLKRAKLIEMNQAVLFDLNSERYHLLSLSERIELFQTIELMEARLGGRSAQKIVVENLPENRLGYFSGIYHRIVVNKTLMEADEPILILEAILHEGRHATQYYLINSLDYSTEHVKNLSYFGNIILFKANFTDYVEYSSSVDNYEAYKDQPVEIDAQYHAIIAMIEYQDGIEGLRVPETNESIP